MTEEEFQALVEKAERDIQSNPSHYRFKLLMFALLGYGIIFALFLLLIGLIGGTIGLAMWSSAFALILLKKKLIIPLVFMAWVIMKALWVRFHPPEGYELKRDAYPELFSEIDSLRAELNALPVHKVILTQDLNAAVVQTPRFGVFGWNQNTLILGLELLLILTPDEARAVLAHEFGHLSKNHSRFSGWIYRVRVTWHRLMEAFDNSNSWGSALMAKFFDWYAPNFSAYSFALARNNEYEADAISAELTTPDIATKALVNVHVTGPYVDEHYWQWFIKKADKLPAPDHMPYEGLSQFVENNEQAKQEVFDRLKEEMKAQTRFHDTHPALKDRVDALGGKPALPKAAKDNAAKSWFAGQFDQVLKDFDQMWKDNNLEKWKQRFEYVQESMVALNEFDNKDTESLTGDELWRFAMLTREFREEGTFKLLKTYQSRYPDDSDAAYLIGGYCLSNGDDNGLEQLKIAVKNPSLTVRACEQAYYYLMEKGDELAAKQWWAIAEKQMQIDHEANLERAEVTVKDDLVAPQLESDLERQMIEQLSAHPKVKAAWVAEKPVQHYPNHPVYIIAFKAKGLYNSWGKVQQNLVETLDLPVDCFAVVYGGSYKKLAKRVKKDGVALDC